LLLRSLCLRCVALIVGASFIIAILGGFVAVGEDYYAVIVGVADYPGTIKDLAYTDDDAVAVYNSLLKDSTRWSPDHVQLLLDSQASKEGIGSAIDVVALQGSSNDVFVLYFSGHGTTGLDIDPLDEADGLDEYICCYGSSLSEFICDDELSDWLSDLPMDCIIVMLDTCFSGGQIKSVAEGAEVKSINQGPAPRSEDGFASDLERANKRAIRPQDLDDLDKQIVVLTASDADEYSWEFGAPMYHGLFTYYLLQALDGAADETGNMDGDVTGEEAYGYLSPRVVSTSDTYHLNQHPQFLTLDSEPLTVRSWDKPGDCSGLSTTLSVEGWHMISIPGAIYGDADVCDALQDDLNPFFLFSFDPAIGGYVMAPPCDGIDSSPGKGYWVRTYDDEVPIDANVELLMSPLTVNVTEGWNQIGDPFTLPVCLQGIQVVNGTQTASFTEASDLSWVSKHLFAYSSAIGGYQMINPPDGELEPWQGYWFRAYTDCSLIIPPVPCPPAPPSSVTYVTQSTWKDVESPPPPPSITDPISQEPTLTDGMAINAVRVEAEPNPTSEKATFAVHGVCWCQVSGLRVQIYDLSGNLVFSQESKQPQLEWYLDLPNGAVAANGVYLWRSWVNVTGNWQQMEVGKLAVER